MDNVSIKRRPSWLKIRLPQGENYRTVRRLVHNQHLHTVCESAHCPNIGECWNRRTATFMILGNTCTRRCSFCAVKAGKPEPIHQDEPQRVAQAVHELKLRYAVVTSVTRDDIDDGGAAIFAATIKAIRNLQPSCKVEVLIPDFLGHEQSLQVVIVARPDILNHNIETVARLYPLVRPQADYQRSLQILKTAAQFGLTTKSGLMLGLGETRKEIEQTMLDLVSVQCQLLTLGQYLPPSYRHIKVQRFVHPDEFASLKEYGLSIGFRHVESGPLVRSSYYADVQTL